MDQLNSDLQRVLEALQRAKKLRGRIAHVEERLKDRNKRRGELRKSLDKELADVRKLEGVSLASIYHSILSDKKERLEKEQAEAFQAKLAYDQCRAEVRQLEGDWEALKEELAALGDVDEEHQELLKRKEALLLSGAGPAAQALLEITEKRATLVAQVREIDEACSAGELAFESLDDMVSSLGSAKGWGTWDMLGGGLLSTAIKHSHVDKAKAYAEEAQGDLFRFQLELEDIQIEQELGVEISGFNRFADYLLDGLIFDWLVQSKIQNSHADAQRVQRQVHGILESLGARRKALTQGLAELEAERKRCIAEA